MSLRGLSAAVIVASLALVACSDDNGGDNTPGLLPTATSPGQPTASSPGAPTADAPKVANPVQNIDKYQKSPCDMLTTNQTATLKFDAKSEPETDYSEGPLCRWHSQNGDFFSIALLNRQPLGISGIYRNNETPGFYAYFEPVDVGGFPGVFSDSYDDRTNGGCGLSVGVTDQQVISLSSSIESSTDPCDLIKSAAEAAVTTMGKG